MSQVATTVVVVPSVIPWHEARDDDGLEIVFLPLPAGVRGFYIEQADGTGTIGLSTALGFADRRATLSHELKHRKRGMCGIARYDERGIDREVAHDAVPCDELGAMYEIAISNDLPVEPWMVAEKFTTPQRVAELAMRMYLDGDRW